MDGVVVVFLRQSITVLSTFPPTHMEAVSNVTRNLAIANSSRSASHTKQEHNSSLIRVLARTDSYELSCEIRYLQKAQL